MNWDKIKEVLGYDAKDRIIKILNSDYFKNSLYIDENGKALKDEDRARLGQFYTPGEVCIKMIDKFECEDLFNKDILDPCVGTGNLLIACLIAGADISRLFGNEYDGKVIPTCINRIKEAFKALYGRYPTEEEFRPWQIHQGNALIPDCLTEFGPKYDKTILKELLKRRNDMSGGYFNNPDRWEEYKKDNAKGEKDRNDKIDSQKEANKQQVKGSKDAIKAKEETEKAEYQSWY